MNLKTSRELNNKTARQLRRARHLFVRFQKKFIEEGGTAALNAVADAAGKYQIWATYGRPGTDTYRRKLRYKILRLMWKMDGGRRNMSLNHPGDWWQWCLKHGWTAYRWEKKAA